VARKKGGKVVRVLLVLVVVALVLTFWVGLSVGPEPAIEIRAEHDVLGPSQTLTVAVAEPRRGLGRVEVVFDQEGRKRTLETFVSEERRGFAPWGAVPVPETEIEVAIDRESLPGLREGTAVLTVTADRAAGFLRSPAPAVVARTFTVRLTPPALAVLSHTHYVAQGGCEVVVYRVGETAASSGVRVGDRFFPGYPLPEGGTGDRFAFFSVPYDLDDPADLRLVVSDEVGNQAEAGFIDRFFPEPLRHDVINLSDSFLGRVVPAILSQTPEIEAPPTLLEGYLAINRDLRARNRAALRTLVQASRAEFLWRGPFLQQRNAQVMARFAERRTYKHAGQTVDTQDHLGIDLASVVHAPVQAANHGIVLRAGWFGIYGNAVVLDHGYGLMTLYGHLSSVAVEKGETVGRGQEIGRTGASGLAGGDHLHYAVLLHGLPVDPLEWWDGHWIHDRLALKLRKALPAAE
jgi:hypothetical protein